MRTDVPRSQLGTNHSKDCIKVVQQMQFVSKAAMPEASSEDDAPIVFFDVEVYPNLFVVLEERRI